MRSLLRPYLNVYRCLLLLPLVALLFLAIPPAQAVGCIYYFEGFDEPFGWYLDFKGGNFLNGPTPVYNDGSCQTATGGDVHFSPGVVYTSSEQTAWSVCEANNSAPISYVWAEGTNSKIWRCEVSGGTRIGPTKVNIRVMVGPVYGTHDSGSALSACRATWPQTTHVELTPPNTTLWFCWYIVGHAFFGGGSGARAGFREIPNLPLDGLRLRAFDGMDSGIQFRRLPQFNIGIQSVLDMGFLDAVDVWSNIGSGYEVCFPLPGRIVFLDAATAPRTMENMEPYIDDRYTCASSDRAGTLVLVEPEAGTAGQPATASQPTPRRPGTNDSIDSAIELENCLITPRYYLRLRSAPWGKILDVVPKGMEVPATARTKSWFQIIYEEQEGWSAAWLADREGDCDWPAEAEDGESVSA